MTHRAIVSHGRQGALHLTTALIGVSLTLAACGEASEPLLEPFEPALASVNAARHTSAMVVTHPSLGPTVPVPGAWATLVTNNNGARATLHTADLEPRHAYTMWLVTIDRPENCAAVPCSGGDVLGNFEGIGANVTYGAGHIAGASGRTSLSTHIRTGAVPGGWYDTEFTNPRTAEVHLIVMEHGPALPAFLPSQISSVRGGCSDESVNTPPISGFPDVAKSDGIPGPNTCRLVQLAILRQD